MKRRKAERKCVAEYTGSHGYMRQECRRWLFSLLFLSGSCGSDGLSRQDRGIDLFAQATSLSVCSDD